MSCPSASEPAFFRWVRSLGWDRTDPRWMGGVCAGVAARTGWDVALIRALVVVATIFFWFPVFVYGVAWMLLPDARTGRILLEELLAGRFVWAQLGAGLMILFGLLNPVPYYVLFAAPWYWFGALAAAGILAFALLRAPVPPNYQGDDPMSFPPYPPEDAAQRGRYGQPGVGAYSYYAPPPYSPVPEPPALPSRIGLMVLGGLFILGAVLLTVGWVSSGGGANSGRYYFLMALGAAISLAVMAGTLVFAAVRGLRGGWFLGVSIAAAVILFPLGLGASAAYQNDWGTFHSARGHRGMQTRVVAAPCEDGVCEVSNRAADFDHTAELIDADNAQVTLDLTRASESMTKEIVLHLDGSEGVILVRPDQALQLFVEGEDSQFTRRSSDGDDSWFPTVLSGDFRNEGSNGLFTSASRPEPAVTFTLDIDLDSSVVQLREVDPESETLPFTQRRDLPQSEHSQIKPAPDGTSEPAKKDRTSENGDAR